MPFPYFQSASHARLDRAHVSAELVGASKKYAVDNVAFSDHRLVSIKLGSSRETAHKFTWHPWRFNAKLLEDEEFVGGGARGT